MLFTNRFEGDVGEQDPIDVVDFITKALGIYLARKRKENEVLKKEGVQNLETQLTRNRWNNPLLIESLQIKEGTENEHNCDGDREGTYFFVFSTIDEMENIEGHIWTLLTKP